ncbi:T9SS type A sorting domain-containing protein [Hymenobacter sp. DH14]|uniref:T9SS type A sorting domain-containing protein n=1 Tax=Hymenobacter cyanobacteriorum TaxID=2926463 RepID=A0A9X1VFF7_9BACT|nr:T9SS type A sorting domain-containing protein [Hymenobacter cyanobacteriorum]MCI1187098.1 T9SS type A sorting domain-containing protein [Hymenobacter cyanobacteriorum]
MMNFFSPYRLRQGFAVGLLGLLFSGSFHLSLPATGRHAPGWMAELEGEDEENDADRPRPDRPDLALLQDMDRTRDPATGTVPTERLLDAARYNEARLKSLALAQRGTATTGLANASWVERGPSNVGGRLLALLVDPTDATGNTVWAGAAGGGLWKATNASSGSIAWTNANSYFNNLAVSALAAVPGTSPLVMYCGTGEGFFNLDAVRGAGIYKSTDGGTTWAPLAATVSNSDFWRIQKIVVHPVTKDVYAATRSGGLYRSKDGGSTWAQVLNTTTSQASASTRVSDIEIAADNKIFVSFGIFNTDGIYRSSTGDAGSWTNLNALSGSGLPTPASGTYERIELACAPSDATRVYAAFQSSDPSTPILDIYRSLDGGTTWQALPKPNDADTGIGADYTRSQAWYDLPLAVSPTDPNTLWAGGIDLFKTTNAGAATASSVSWQQVTHWYGGFGFQDVHADQHAIAFPNGSGSKIYVGNDGGFYASTNPTAAIPTLTAGNAGLNVTQFYGVAMHPTNANYFLAGAQDNGTHKFTAAGVNATTEVTGGDGGLSAIDQDVASNQFTSYVYNDYFRSTDGGASFTEFELSASSGSFINPWDYDSQANVLYAGWNTNTYLAWTNPLTASNFHNARTNTPALPANSGDVAFVGISPLTANRIYLGTGSSFTANVNDGGLLYRVDNANTNNPTIKTLYTGPVNTSVSCVAVDPGNEQHLLVTLSNYGIVSVLETTNADAATPTWTSVEGALPDMPVRWALFDPRNTTRALLATEMGVYATDRLNGSSTAWNPITNGPLNVRVDMLRYRAGDKLVAAATHGRGLFTSAIFNPATPLPVTLTSLAATREASGAAVRWQTASEQRSARFEVERSIDAVNYQKVGSVAAAGNSSSARSYTFPDATAGLGAYYYRLRQVDTDGTVTYSAPVALAAAASAGNALLSSVYPVPFRHELNIELTQPAASGASLELVDAQGRRAWAGTIATTGRQLQVSIPAAVAPGTYVLTVRANGQLVRRRVVKE